MPDTHHFPPLSKHKMTSEILIVDGLHSRQSSTPSREEDAVLVREALDKAQDRLEALCVCVFVCAGNRPGRKRHFVPPQPRGCRAAGPLLAPCRGLMLHILPVLTPARSSGAQGGGKSSRQGRAGHAQRRPGGEKR